MFIKNKLFVSLLVAGLILSACHVNSTTPDNFPLTNQQEIPISEAYSLEENPITEIIGQMYPAGNSQIITAYPIWAIATIKPQDLQPPTEANDPTSGKVSISGLLYAFNISVPLSNTAFVLMPAMNIEGVAIVPPILTNGDPEDGDVLGKTDENGLFYLDDILPGQYYIIVNYPDHSEIAIDPNNTTEPLLLEFNADTSYPLGVIMILS